CVVEREQANGAAKAIETGTAELPQGRDREARNQKTQGPKAERAFQNILRLGAELIGQTPIEVQNGRRHASDVERAPLRVGAENQARESAPLPGSCGHTQ